MHLQVLSRCACHPSTASSHPATAIDVSLSRHQYLNPSCGPCTARLGEQHQQLDALSAGLPAWVCHLGGRRCLERAWTAWRLAVVQGLRTRMLSASLRSLHLSQHPPTIRYGSAAQHLLLFIASVPP